MTETNPTPAEDAATETGINAALIEGSPYAQRETAVAAAKAPAEPPAPRYTVRTGFYHTFDDVGEVWITRQNAHLVESLPSDLLAQMLDAGMVVDNQPE